MSVGRVEISRHERNPVEQATEVIENATSESESSSAPTLNTADRCDSCGAQAYVRVTLASGELLFCAHHANEVKEKLESIAIKWQDESEKLLVR
jgi:hypothetical protein